MTDNAEWLTPGAAAAVLGVSRQRVYQIGHDGRETPWPVRTRFVDYPPPRGMWLYHAGDCAARADGMADGL